METCSEDRVQFLKSKPYWTSTHDKMLEHLQSLYPGTCVVAMPSDVHLKPYIKSPAKPIVSTAKNTLFPDLGHGSCGNCHMNVDVMLTMGMVKEGHFGYALSEDGLWREHSWGMLNGHIVETTCSRLAYVSLKNLMNQTL